PMAHAYSKNVTILADTPSQFFEEPARRVPVRAEYDVLVLGGGPSGLIAALAAAESGQRVGLVESRSFVGGNMTIGLPVLGFLGQKKNQVIQGMPERFIQRLRQVNGASEHRACPLHMGITLVEPEAVKTIGLEMLVEAGVEITLHAMVADVLTEGRKIKGIVLQSKGGREVYTAKIYIDCTGDADVAYAAGVPTEKGNDDGGLQPPTLMFCLAGVDTEKLRYAIAEHPKTYLTDFIPADYFGQNNQFIVVGLKEVIKEAQAAGFHIPTERTIIITGLRPGEAWINMTRMKGVDGTDVHSMTAGEIEGRQQIPDIQRYLREYVPGFENCYFTKAAPFLGIRETRRILGHYVMDRNDVLSCRHFDDGIAVASYPIDIHRPTDNGCTLEWCGDCYDIPYRSLVPLEVDNLLVAGRCISTTHEAMAAIRVMATCMAMGEAAGRAAAMCSAQGIRPEDLDVQALRNELRARGAYLREPIGTGRSVETAAATA
ncbi:MAG: FAD-dependent oxidoreductase, partial [Bryocella sp.]